MSDIWNFIRTSSNRIFGKRPPNRSTGLEHSGTAGFAPSDGSYSSSSSGGGGGTTSGLIEYTSTPCRHVSDTKWDELQSDVIGPKQYSLSGLVAVNPTFARPRFVPQSVFRCGYDDQLEYGIISLDLLATMKTEQYEAWMRSMLRPESAFVLLHVCQAAQLLERLAVRCPQLTRLSFHYYYLDDDFVAYLLFYKFSHFGQLTTLNLEASIGLSTRAYEALGQLPSLAHLNLSGTDISEAGVARILECCKHLESLDVSDNCLITGQCFTLPAMKSQIKRLNIRDCWRIDSAHLVAMANGAGGGGVGLPNLAELIFNSGLSDESIVAISANCPNLMHLDISFEEFTYNDDTGYNQLSEAGFAAIGQLTGLHILRLRHVGRLTDKSLATITASCAQLAELTLNLRHRHKLTDRQALASLARHCPRLKYFEAVHNHFVSKYSLQHLAELSASLKYLLLRGDELISDSQAADLVRKCPHLRALVLDGCPLVGEKTLDACINHAKLIPETITGAQEEFQASLVCTSVDRSLISDMVASLPANLKLRASDQNRNKEHYSHFDGQRVQSMKLRLSFFPFYWQDYN